MTSIWYDLFFIIPEINLIIGAMLCLLIGAFSKSNCFRSIAILAIVLLITSLFKINFDQTTSQHLFHGMLVISPIAVIAKSMVIIAAIFVLLMLIGLNKIEKYLQFEIIVLILISIAGMMLLVSANNLLTLYLALEMTSLPLYILASFHRDDNLSAEAGLKYFILGAVASGIYLFGASLVYGFTGYGNFDDINNYYINVASVANTDVLVIPKAFLVGLILITVALCFKISAAPFHMWAPDVYQGSPTIVTTFFASAPKIATIILFARILFEGFADLSDQWIQIVIFISIASMFVGSLGAIMQKNLKRLLAYSSIGHVGFALVGLASGDSGGVKGMLIYMMIYLVMTLGIFALIMILRKDGIPSEEISDLSGLAKSHPTLAFAIAVLMFSLAGIPPFAGFFAKFYVLTAAINQELYSFAVVVVIASVIAAYYYLRIVKVMYFDEGKTTYDVYAPFSIKFTSALCVALNIFFVFFPTPVIVIAEQAALSLFN